jgi:ADP-ribose pyrophosphatase YjhB (NUDIX family)
MKIYKESGKYKEAPFLSDLEYRKVLSSFIKYCVDVIILDKEGNFLLPERRKTKTASGPWFVGGQVPAFKSTEDQILTIFKRETNLKISFKRFKKVTQLRYWFSDVSNGKTPQDSISEIYKIVLNEDEISRIILDTDEYVANSIKRYNLKDIKNIKYKLARNVFSDLWNLLYK